MTEFKSKLKVRYSSELEMYCIVGKSLTRTDTNGLTFYDKKVATDFKKTVDNQDFYFFNDSKLK